MKAHKHEIHHLLPQECVIQKVFCNINNSWEKILTSCHFRCTKKKKRKKKKKKKNKNLALVFSNNQIMIFLLDFQFLLGDYEN